MILTSLAVGSGVALAFSGPGNGPWLFAHKASFILWRHSMLWLTGCWKIWRRYCGDGC